MSEGTENTPKLLMCDCLGTQSIDGEALEQASGLPCSRVFTHLCGRDAEHAAKAMAAGDTIIACGQETRFFEELAEDIGAAPAHFVDLRDRAGWSADTATKTAKQAALLADALLPQPATKTVDVTSEGLCLIIGNGAVAIEAAQMLQDTLGVTVLLTDATDAPDTRDFDVIRGKIKSASGALGGFDMKIDALQQLEPAGRGAMLFDAPRDGASSMCDIILDLSGGTPLFPAHEKREGYLRADPGSAHAVAKASFDAAQLVGTFEKPLYVRLEPVLCAHSRAEQTACSNCIDNCPTSAITSAGDHVTIDPMACAGCGSCSSLCPSGAISYEAPTVDFTIRRVQTIAQRFLEAGGEAPRLLVVDAHGSEMIRLLARHGDGLPADVIPFEVPALNLFGHAEAVAARAAGFVTVNWVPGPGTEKDALNREIELAEALSGPGAMALIDVEDPDLLGQSLYAAPECTPVATPIRPMGSRRQITRQATRALSPDNDLISLPETAPYGAVLVDQDACTLCLSCASLCPSGALGDNPDLPQLRFQEDACLQCGLCANVCPENAIAYEPRMNLASTALEQVVLYEEEPFACIECGTLFGSKSTIMRITEKLAGHSMYKDNKALDMIQMCDTCRVNAQFHSDDNPFAAGERPRTRTTEDYLSKRRDH